jgi:hypothetical protein
MPPVSLAARRDLRAHAARSELRQVVGFSAADEIEQKEQEYATLRTRTYPLGNADPLDLPWGSILSDYVRPPDGDRTSGAASEIAIFKETWTHAQDVFG